MILIYLAGSGCVLVVGLLFGMYLRYLVNKTDRENKEMEAILKQYGKNKTNRADGGHAGNRNGGDLSNSL